MGSGEIQCTYRRTMWLQKRQSTKGQIISLTSEIQTAFKNKQQLKAVIFDLKKAFDTMWKHNIMLSLKETGIEGNLLNFVNKLLSNRLFTVEYQGV